MVNDEIKRIAKKIKDTLLPKKIYLFGSFAKNSCHQDSDYDFYVVMPDQAGDRIHLAQKAYKALRGIRTRPVDILIGYESSFAQRSQQQTIEKSVWQEGILLYGE